MLPLREAAWRDVRPPCGKTLVNKLINKTIEVMNNLLLVVYSGSFANQVASHLRMIMLTCSY